MCGNQFTASAAQIKRGRGKYCSRPCLYKNGTSSLEIIVGDQLKEWGIVFDAQVPFRGRRFYVLDFLLDGGIALEVNGCYWHGHGCGLDSGGQEARQSRDRDLHADLAAIGLSNVAVWECAIKEHGVEQAVSAALEGAEA